MIKHYALRLILWLSGCIPFKFIKFLDHCAKLIFLKKVGGGYIFIQGCSAIISLIWLLRPRRPKKERPVRSAPRSLTLQIFRNRRKLLQRRFEFLGYLQSEHVRIRKICAVFERFVPQPENVEIHFVAFE